MERISRASGGWIHAEDPAHAKRLLDTLMDEAQLGFASDATVIQMDVQWGPDGEAAAQRVREYLESNPPSRDPVLEVFRLARAWETGYLKVRQGQILHFTIVKSVNSTCSTTRKPPTPHVKSH